MSFELPARRRRLFAPEVVQTSAMDCGPAALKCLLEGFGIPVSYGRLREACQTDVDGTSIDTLEEVANQLGLVAEQTLLPSDHLLVSEARALPALVVARLPDGMTHFVVAWRRHGQWVQVMDPSVGRRWFTHERFLDELYVHSMAVPAAGWREWVESDEFQGALGRRLKHVGLGGGSIATLVRAALEDPGWRTAAALDAATRLVDTLVRGEGIRPGRQAARVLKSLVEEQTREPAAGESLIPESCWSVRPAPSSPDGQEQLWLRGAVIVRVRGRRRDSANSATEPEPAPARQPLSPDLIAALEEKPARPTRDLLRFLRADGLLAPTILITAMALAAVGVTAEAVLLRGLFDLGKELLPPRQRLGALAAVVAFVALITLLELPIAVSVRRFGRKLEARLRVAFLEKIPRLGDRYFRSRPISDMAERGHSVHELRTLPAFAGGFIRAVFEVLFTVAGIAWLDPAGAPFALLAAVVATGLPLAFQRSLAERDLRMRTHQGALGRFYLDSLMGLIPIRAHGAERSVRREHERVLAEWTRAGLGLQRVAISVEGAQSLIGLALAAGLLFGYLSRHPDVGGVLLMVYWSLNLPLLGQKVGTLAWQYPSLRNLALRLFEPLGAPEEASRATPLMSSSESDSSRDGDRGGAPLSLRLEDVSVRAAGHTILEAINVSIDGGSHVAIVGPSGAGKSSLVGLLLGWHRAASGSVLVDNERLEGTRLDELRQCTAWVDPAVQLWNRSLFDNLHYGLRSNGQAPVASAIEAADLRKLLETLPDGLQTTLGEGGALVSGGEGQRVRFGRALLRRSVRLAILDEPFRGLDRQKRRSLLARARELWRDSTLLCITHDVGETGGFERVLVIEDGRIAEDGRPSELAARPDSRYRAMLQAEEEVQKSLWSGATWRRWRLDSGRLHEEGQAVST